jgi:very-short-patch-repair endonuclease
MTRRMTTPPLTGSVAEQTLAVQLERDGIPFEREYRFHPTRRWRSDFAVIRDFAWRGPLLIEIDGGAFVGGRHSRGTGVEADAEKQSAAAILGYRVIRATPRQVENGTALSWIKAALGIERAA